MKKTYFLPLVITFLFLVSCVPQQVSEEELQAELAKLTPEEREQLVKDLESKDSALAGQAVKSAKYGPIVAKAPAAQVKAAVKKLSFPVPKPQCGSDQECPSAYACIDNKCVPKEKKDTGAYRTLTFAEIKTIGVTMPILHLSAVPTYNMYAWISDDNLAWEQIFWSDAYFKKNSQETEFYILLDRIPRYVRVEGKPYGGAAVNLAEIILPDGKKILPGSAKVNDINKMDAVNAKDNNYADLNAGLNLSLEFPVVPGLPQKFSLNLPKVPLESPKVGFYAGTYAVNDPSLVPKGYLYLPNASEYAFYDFSVLQANPGLDGLEQKNFVNKLKQINPNHKVILRLLLVLPPPENKISIALDYFYDGNFREQLKKIVLNEIERVNSANLYGVTLSEEELAIQFSGFYGQAVPEWLNKYVSQYETETNKKFDRYSDDVKNWLSEKAKFMFNDLYAAIDSKKYQGSQGTLKIIQWAYIPGDKSGFSWMEPKGLNNNGWVIQWHGDWKVSVLKPAAHQLPEIKEVYLRERSFNLQVQKLRDAGVPNNEIYANINGYDPASMGTAIWQLEMVREAGVNNIFVFYYGALMPPAPLISTYPDFYKTVNGILWSNSYAERQDVEKYVTNLKK